MKNRISKHTKIMVALVLPAIIFISCSEIYDNISEHVKSEKIYADKLDGIVNVQIGYERVEIDLMNAGRIPASRINMGKAKKTIIECEDFDEPNHRREIDSICSWVNITGLNQLKNYQFTIYTEDEYGNRSLPLKAEAKPYTSENRDALDLVPPVVTESSSAALIEWQNHLTSKLFNFYSYTYEYTDKDGLVHKGGNHGDIPIFFVENVTKGQNIPITLTCRIIPKIDNTAILDTIDWQQKVILNISPNATPAIFLKSPEPAVVFDANTEDFPFTFSWVKAEEISAYKLKISNTASFPEDETIVFDAGNTDMFEMDESTVTAVFSRLITGTGACYWTVVPASSGIDVKSQVRQFTAIRKPPAVVGYWTFDDPSDLGKANIGQDLISVGNGFSPVEGPDSQNKAVRISKGNYYKCLHGLPAVGDNQVNEYTVMFYLKLSQSQIYSLLQTNINNSDEGDVFVNTGGHTGSSSLGYSKDAIGPGQWHRIAFSVKSGKFFHCYMDGILFFSVDLTAASVDSHIALDPAGVLFFADNNGRDGTLDLAEIVIWNGALNAGELVEYAGLKKSDKSGWVISAYSSQEVDFPASNMIDDQYELRLWHTQWQGQMIVPPHWAVIDMRSLVNIQRLITVRRNEGDNAPADTKTVQYFIGNTPDPDGSWTKIAEGRWDTGNVETSGSFLAFDIATPATGRYLKIYFPDSHQSCINVVEIEVYEKK